MGSSGTGRAVMQMVAEMGQDKEKKDPLHNYPQWPAWGAYICAEAHRRL
jgi:hypothetical protein